MNPNELEKLEAVERFEKIPRKVHAEQRNAKTLQYKRKKIDWSKSRNGRKGDYERGN
ncbi:hypothetical protein CCP3SC1AL1_2030002 [Gammaproteobacteria bacterium]